MQLRSAEYRALKVHERLDIAWTAVDQLELERSLRRYTRHVSDLLKSGQPIRTHIPGAWSIALPICDTTTPEALFATLGEVEYEQEDHGAFWLTTHYPNPEPVVTLIPKSLPGQPKALLRLCHRLGELLGRDVGGEDGAFLACISAHFAWAMHTDDDNSYELVGRRVHVPLRTTPHCVMAWGDWDSDGNEVLSHEVHLEKGAIHHVRVDVPHTVINRDPVRSRTHLIIDVRD